MDFDSKDLVLSVAPGQNNQWHVTALDSTDPLASFDDPQTACAWAVALAKPKQGRVVVEELAPSDTTSARDLRNPPEAFKFSIPVTWTESRDSRFRSARS
jgi:hypothetical protein